MASRPRPAFAAFFARNEHVHFSLWYLGDTGKTKGARLVTTPDLVYAKRDAAAQRATGARSSARSFTPPQQCKDPWKHTAGRACIKFIKDCHSENGFFLITCMIYGRGGNPGPVSRYDFSGRVK